MNTEGIKISQEIRDLVATVHQRDWDAMFQSLAEAEARSIVSTADEELPKLKTRITVISELRTLFSDIRNLNIES